MKLAENIVRVNGYLANGKRGHMDFEVPTCPNTTNWGKGKIYPIYRDDDMVDRAFKAGMAAVTSINAYNYVGDERITTRIW